MTTFFIILELLTPLVAIYLLLKKRELVVLYLPALFFASGLFVPTLPASVSYLLTSVLVFSLIFTNPTFYKHNLPAVLLFGYFLLLLPRSSNLEIIRPYIFSVSWLLLLIPTIIAIYQKYEREVILKELYRSAALILVLFIVNVAISTVNRYSPFEMYGITSGILFGNLYATDFNILAIALFVVTSRFITHKNAISLILILVSFSFLLLSMRRSVLLVSALGIFIPYLNLLTKEKAQMFFLLGALTLTIGFAVYSTTDLADSFKERYALRQLDDRELEEEKRFFEYELIYKDMFVYHDYDPLIGKEMFNSWGKYGRGILEDRSLHGDLTSITHSSGLIGLLIYLCMVVTAFRKSIRAAVTRADKLTIGFCMLAILVYTVTGRYTNIAAMVLLYLLLAIPLAQAPDTTDALPDEEQDEEETTPRERLRRLRQLHNKDLVLKQ